MDLVVGTECSAIPGPKPHLPILAIHWFHGPQHIEVCSSLDTSPPISPHEPTDFSLSRKHDGGELIALNRCVSEAKSARMTWFGGLEYTVARQSRMRVPAKTTQTLLAPLILRSRQINKAHT